MFNGGRELHTVKYIPDIPRHFMYAIYLPTFGYFLGVNVAHIFNTYGVFGYLFKRSTWMLNTAEHIQYVDADHMEGRNSARKIQLDEGPLQAI